MDQCRAGRQSGFTLIEIIAVLVIVGIAAAFGGMFVASILNGFMFTQSNAETAQKAQFFLGRLSMEFENITDISQITDGSANVQMRYTTRLKLDEPDLERILTFTDSTVTLSHVGAVGSTLMDNVSAFDLRFKKSDGTETAEDWTIGDTMDELYTIYINLTLKHAGLKETSSTFSTAICPKRPTRRSLGPDRWNR